MENVRKELTENELKQVTGGGSGSIPPGGIAFESYSTLEPDHYYAKQNNFIDVIYVYEISNNLYYTREAFVVDTSTKTWWSRSSSSGSANPIENVEGFMFLYKYKLNISPNHTN